MIDIGKITQKIRKYCAYQERSQQEVRDKLYSEGLHKAEVERLIAELIGEGFVNEERFAIAYAGGKLRIKHWGRIKIIQALKAKKVSEYCIRHAVKQISSQEYEKAFDTVVNIYSKKLSEKDLRKRKHKIAQHAISKGFEADYVWEKLNEYE